MNTESRTRRPWLIAGAVVVLAGALAWWLVLTPPALSFAGSHSVSLTNYKGPSPTGVPAELGAGDVIARGKYLTQAADCEVCHTREGGQPFTGNRHRLLERCRLRARRASGNRQGRPAALPGISV
jgi:hypothetical protein